MAFSVFGSRGTPLGRQHTTWRDMVRKPISKLDDDAFTRMRIVLMNGIELDVLRFSHMAARCNLALRQPLGGDPTAQTAGADVAGVESLGLVQVLNDPRTGLAQSLHALLTAELADRAGWETLIALVGEAGQDDLVAGFTLALEDEHRHLALVQGWYHEAIGLTPVASMLPPDLTTPGPGADI